MVSIKRNQRGSGQLEILLLVVIVAAIAGVGWYVYNTKQTSDKSLNAAASTNNNTSPSFANNSKGSSGSGDTSNASLQADQKSATSSADQYNKDISSTNSSLGDQSSLTSVPQ